MAGTADIPAGAQRDGRSPHNGPHNGHESPHSTVMSHDVDARDAHLLAQAKTLCGEIG